MCTKRLIQHPKSFFSHDVARMIYINLYSFTVETLVVNIQPFSHKKYNRRYPENGIVMKQGLPKAPKEEMRNKQ